MSRASPTKRTDSFLLQVTVACKLRQNIIERDSGLKLDQLCRRVISDALMWTKKDFCDISKPS